MGSTKNNHCYSDEMCNALFNPHLELIISQGEAFFVANSRNLVHMHMVAGSKVALKLSKYKTGAGCRERMALPQQAIGSSVCVERESLQQHLLPDRCTGRLSIVDEERSEHFWVFRAFVRCACGHE